MVTTRQSTSSSSKRTADLPNDTKPAIKKSRLNSAETTSSYFNKANNTVNVKIESTKDDNIKVKAEPITPQKSRIPKIEIKYENDPEEMDLLHSFPSSTTPILPNSVKKVKKESSRPSTPTKIRDSLPPKDPPKENWLQVYNLIKEYRKVNKAVVDSMGCAWLAEKTLDPKIFRFQTLCALMLSSQTKDEITAAAIENLKSHKPGGLTVDSILSMDSKTLNGYICKVGFHNNKTRYLKETAVMLKEKYDGDIPKTIEGLVELPGVGPKMAFLCLQCAWGINEGIGVDIHVHRISNRLGWAKTSKTGPEGTRVELESWLPKEKWADVNPMLVGFGQICCQPLRPKCHECPVGKEGLCPSKGTKSGM